MKDSLSWFFVVFIVCLAKTAISSSEPPSIGNFSLPTSQQPGPFISFGQNIINKGQMQWYFTTSRLQGADEHYLYIQPQWLYGLSDDSSLLLTLPVAADYLSNDQHAFGLADASAQLEYAYHNLATSSYSQTATVVGAITAPTGSVQKNPATGYGVPSYFLGTTFNQTYINWLWYASAGGSWIQPKASYQQGAQYVYQTGLARTLSSKTNGYIMLGLLEFDGIYSMKNKLLGQPEANSGGNIVMATPSFWFSTKRFIMQLGLSLPIIQTLNGQQNKTYYMASAEIVWTMND